MADKTDLIDKIIDSGIDIRNRRIYFGVTFGEALGSDFSWVTVEYVIRAMHRMVSDAAKKPIEIHMSSYGGETYSMLRLYDAIQTCPCQVKFFGSGVIMSSATWIMAGCDERYLAPNTRVMLHKWRADELSGAETDLKIDMEEGDRLTETLNNVYADNSRMPADFWEEVTKRDLFLSADETITLGLADFITPYKKRGNLRRKRIAAMNKEVDQKDMRKLVRDINKRIHRGKNLHIEIHVPKEEFDKDVVIDDTPIVDQSYTQTNAHSSLQNVVEHSLDKAAGPRSDSQDDRKEGPSDTSSSTGNQEPTEN